jgi:hypothetical protein
MPYDIAARYRGVAKTIGADWVEQILGGPGHWPIARRRAALGWRDRSVGLDVPERVRCLWHVGFRGSSAFVTSRLCPAESFSPWFPTRPHLVATDTSAARRSRRGGLCRPRTLASAPIVPTRVALARRRCPAWRDARSGGPHLIHFFELHLVELPKLKPDNREIIAARLTSPIELQRIAFDRTPHGLSRASAIARLSFRADVTPAQLRSFPTLYGPAITMR